MIGVRSSGGDKRADRTGFGDAFLENLPVFRFLVIKKRIHVHRLVELAHAGINSHLAEERFHAEGAGFVRDDGHDQFADFRIAQQFSQQPHENHGGRDFAAVRAFVKFFEVRLRNRSNRLGAHFALRQVAAQLLAAFLHVADFRTVIRGTMERRVVQFLVGDGNPEARAEHAQLVFVQLFLLVSDVLAFTGLAQSIALDGLGQNDRGRSLVLDRRLVGGVHFDGIVPAQPHAGKLFVGKMLDHLQQARIAAEQVVPEVSAALDEIFLILAVRDLAHALDQDSITIVADEVVPVAAPDDLDHVPAGAAENRFQFLNDLAVAAHRSIQALQVAVDHKDQVVEALARRQRDGAQRFRLIHLAVAHETPRLCRRWPSSTRDFPDSE